MSTNRLLQLQALLAETPGDSFLTYAIAKEYEGMGDDQQALEYYQQLLEADPGYVGAYYHLGKLYERIEAVQQALMTYTQGIACARELGDQHALAELQGAKVNLEMEL
jgi:tetratricopeptide (TPR) repeat protein